MESEIQPRKRGPVRRSLVACGKCCAGVGLILLVGAVAGLVPVSAFELGGESGYRVMGAMAVLGCVMMAIGFFDE